MASTILSALPPVIMFLLLQRWVGEGADAGGGQRIARGAGMLTRRDVMKQAGAAAALAIDRALVVGTPGSRGAPREIDRLEPRRPGTAGG